MDGRPSHILTAAHMASEGILSRWADGMVRSHNDARLVVVAFILSRACFLSRWSGRAVSSELRMWCKIVVVRVLELRA